MFHGSLGQFKVKYNFKMHSELFITEDGSHTLYVAAIDECYHSTHGALQESKHIFIDSCLKFCKKDDINILEIGFGTGLNAFLSMIEAEKNNKRINFTSIEKYPVELEKATSLNYPDKISISHKDEFERLHSCGWGSEVSINPNFKLTKLNVDFTTFNFTSKFDLIYFDAFSPEKQPEMWTEKLFAGIYAHCNANAILTTYCAKGAVRRAMQSAGYVVERIPGPPGKREILRGRKL